MAYCTVQDIDDILAQSVTSATDPTSQQMTSLLNIGNVRDPNTIPESTVLQYIQWGSQEVDAILNELYVTPFSEIADYESYLYSDINDYNPYIVLPNPAPLNVNDKVVISDGAYSNQYYISEVIDSTTYATTFPVNYSFMSGNRIIRVKFPDPIPWITIRLSAANLYDKFYSAQVSPNISDYGKFLREQARQKINDISNGRTILHGSHRIGNRFYNSNLSDQYGLPNGNAMERNTEKLT